MDELSSLDWPLSPMGRPGCIVKAAPFYGVAISVTSFILHEIFHPKLLRTGHHGKSKDVLGRQFRAKLDY